MSRTLMSIAQVLSLLVETPQRIADLTAGMSATQLRAKPGPDEWSAVDVLAHLRSCADVWGGAIVTILAGDHPTIRAINPLTWIKHTDYLDLEFTPSFQVFTAQRDELLPVLESLPADGWTRAATVTGAGKPLQRSVSTYARWLARHERQHVKQIGRIVEAIRG